VCLAKAMVSETSPTTPTTSLGNEGGRKSKRLYDAVEFLYNYLNANGSVKTKL
jgi:hypothetical protein